MNERGIRLRLAIFTLIAFGMLAGLIFLFAGSPRFFQNRVEYVVMFPDAPGITAGAPVRRSGVRIGEVKTLELVPETGLVRITMRVDPKYAPRSKEDITLTRGLITNDTSIDLIPRTTEKVAFDLGEVIPIGTELVGIPPPDARSLIMQASEVLPSAQASLDQIRRSVQRLDKVTPRLEEALVSIRDAASTIGEFVPELRRTNDEVRGFVTGIRTSVPELRETNKQIQVLLINANSVAEELRVFLKTNEPELTRTIKSVAETVDRVSDVFNTTNRQNINKTIANVTAASGRFETVIMKTDDALKKLTDTITESGQEIQKLLVRARTAFDNVEKRFDEFVKTLEPYEKRFARIITNVESITNQANQGVMDVREVIRAFTRPDGTIQKLLTDAGIYNQTYDAIVNLNKLFPRLDRILQDFEVFADKIARHPESIGVGGVVRPGAGIKEAPNTPLPRSALFPQR